MAEQAHEPASPASKVNRRRFLLGASLGLGAAAAVFGPLKGLLWGGNNPAPMASNDLPGEDSIFHPRRDANLEAYERRTRGV